jgi:SAM-dependent methyltransferase
LVVVYDKLQTDKKTKEGMSGVVDFYSGLNRSSRDRPSQILRLRMWNNFAKAVALQSFAPQGVPIRMLDIACGKGSDYFKTQMMFGSALELYTGFDITERAILDFRERLCARPAPPATTVETAVMDARAPLPPMYIERYNIVNIAFAFHYFFESLDTIHTVFENLSRCLMDSGRVVITTGDFHAITSKLCVKAPGRKELRVVSDTLDLVARIVEVDGLNGYFFELLDGPGEYAVRAQEFFVPPETVRTQAEANGMDVVYECNLLDFATRNLSNPLAHQMGVGGASGELTDAERACMQLYNVIVLEKRPRIRAPMQVRFSHSPPYSTTAAATTVETETAFGPPSPPYAPGYGAEEVPGAYDDYEF